MTTNGTYQMALPSATETNAPAWTGQLKSKLIEMFKTGFWYCQDCRQSTERIESDQGQPAKCGHCGSVRLEWRKPVILSDGSQLIQPGDL